MSGIARAPRRRFAREIAPGQAGPARAGAAAAPARVAAGAATADAARRGARTRRQPGAHRAQCGPTVWLDRTEFRRPGVASGRVPPARGLFRAAAARRPVRRGRGFGLGDRRGSRAAARRRRAVAVPAQLPAGAAAPGRPRPARVSRPGRPAHRPRGPALAGRRQTGGAGAPQRARSRAGQSAHGKTAGGRRRARAKTVSWRGRSARRHPGGRRARAGRAVGQRQPRRDGQRIARGDRADARAAGSRLRVPAGVSAARADRAAPGRRVPAGDQRTGGRLGGAAPERAAAG